MSESQEKRPEDLARELDNVEVTELDTVDLEGVSGGNADSDLVASGEDGNCGCSAGRPVPAGTWQNANCVC